MCKTQKDELISLSLDAKAKFSPIAKEDSISGVHTVDNLLKKRMPIVVRYDKIVSILLTFLFGHCLYQFSILIINRLVQGTKPKGLKQPFAPEMRLLACVKVDRVFALPLHKDIEMFAVPISTKIKLQRAKNMEQLEHFIEYTRFMEKAQRLLTDARDCLHIVDFKFASRDNNKDSQLIRSPEDCNESIIPGGYVMHKSTNCDLSKCMHPSPLADEYDDVDQIYDYVRGFAPLPKTLHCFESEHEVILPNQANQVTSKMTSEIQIKSQTDSGNYSLAKSNTINHIDMKRPNSNYYHHSIVAMNLSQEEKPIPPPIETIPGKKLSEKRDRQTLPKLYIKNIGSQDSRSPSGNVSPCNVFVINSKDALEPQSPLFHIR